VCTVAVSFSLVVGILFLEETHAEKKHRRDPGLEAGKWILSRFSRFYRCAEAKVSGSEKAGDADDILSLLSDDDQPSGYSTTNAGSPRLQSTDSPQGSSSLLDVDEERDGNGNGMASRSKPAAAKAFTKQVVLNIVAYGILA
jgi:hypothetical protein